MDTETAVGARRGERKAAGERTYEGYMLVDPLGQKLGRVERAFCNGAGEPQYVRIRMGLFGLRLALIPVMDLAVDHDNRDLALR